MCVGKPAQLTTVTASPDSDVGIHGDIEILNQARNTFEAVHLVRLGARAALVCQLTGLTKAFVSRLYPPLTGLSSPPGQVPFTDTWYLKNNRRLLHANVVWRLFQHLEQIGTSTASVLIHVYEAYLEITDTPILTLTRAFFVPRLVTMNAWFEQTCDYCCMSYIGPQGYCGSTCPACIEYFNHRCRSCGTAIEYRPAGRRKAVCPKCFDNQKRSRKRLTYGTANGYPGL